jgi:hypothetical protein
MVALMAGPLTVPLVIGSVIRTPQGIDIGLEDGPRLRLARKRREGARERRG